MLNWKKYRKLCVLLVANTVIDGWRITGSVILILLKRLNYFINFISLLYWPLCTFFNFSKNKRKFQKFHLLLIQFIDINGWSNVHFNIEQNIYLYLGALLTSQTGMDFHFSQFHNINKFFCQHNFSTVFFFYAILFLAWESQRKIKFVVTCFCAPYPGQ